MFIYGDVTLGSITDHIQYLSVQRWCSHCMHLDCICQKEQYDSWFVFSSQLNFSNKLTSFLKRLSLKTEPYKQCLTNVISTYTNVTMCHWTAKTLPPFC